jgi:Rrf2 family protein
VRVSAKADYAVRVMIELARGSEEKPIKAEVAAAAQRIPPRFLDNILNELGHHDLVNARRGAEGGYWLGRPADDITIAEIISAVEGPLATVRGEPADELEYADDAKALEDVWLALSANIRQVLESVTLADLVAGNLPEPIRGLAEHRDVSEPR